MALPSAIGKIRETFDGSLTVEWRIDDYRKIESSKHTSPPFQFSNTSWVLNFEKVNYSSFRIFLGYALNSPGETVICKFHLRRGNGCLKFLSRFTWLYSKWQPCGIPINLSQSKHPVKPDYLPSGALIIVCVLTKFPPPLELSPLSSGLKKLLDFQKHCDVTIRIGKQEFKAHKVILEASSEVFAEMLNRGTKENSPDVVTISDSDPSSFKDFLDFLYTGRANITWDNVFHLYRTADKFAIEDLRSHCVAVMMQNMTVDNICDVATLDNRHSDTELFCCMFFKENFRRILHTLKWEVLMKEKPDVANTLLKYMASEKEGNDSDCGYPNVLAYLCYNILEV